MADTTASSENIVKNWKSKTHREYVRENRLARYAGTGSNNVIVMRESEEKEFSVPFIGRSTGAGVTTGALVGNEESLDNFGWTVYPGFQRNAIVATKDEIRKVAFDMMGESRSNLSTWAREQVRDKQIDAFGAFYDGTTYANYGKTYADGSGTTVQATEAQKDGWLANNDGVVNRVIFGNALSNQSATDHSASLSNIDNTNDQLTSGLVSLIKRMAQTADPHITPLKTREDDEFFVMFVGSLARRDLMADTAFQQALREAGPRGNGNPLFKGGDLMWDNVLIHEVPEISAISGAGAAGIDVEPVYLCGAEALGFGIGSRPSPTRLAEDDYEFRKGVGIELLHDVKKMFWNNIQNGVVTGYVAGVADS